MSIFEYDEEKELALLREAEREGGVKLGMQQGIQQGIQVLITSFKELDIPADTVKQKLKTKYELGEADISKYMEMYW